MEIIKKLENYSDVLTLSETADILRVSKDSIKNLIALGFLKCFRIGRLYRFRKKDIIEFLEKHEKDKEEK